jgi:Pyruvate flavodoxin/ferredoxin oxidoreductase, thiamine diP-bdg
MTNRRRITVGGNEAAASVAYRASETIAIYPITPSSPMAELCDARVRHGEWRGAAEARGRFRCLAALSLRSTSHPQGEPPLHLDYGPPKIEVVDYLRNESRFRTVERSDPARYKKVCRGVSGRSRAALRRVLTARGYQGAGLRGASGRRRAWRPRRCTVFKEV